MSSVFNLVTVKGAGKFEFVPCAKRNIFFSIWNYVLRNKSPKEIRKGTEESSVALFCPTLECWNMASHQWKLKNNDEVCLLRLNKSSETVCGSLLLQMARIEMDVVLRNFSQFFKALVSIFKGKPKMCHGLLFLQKVDWSLSLKFLGNGSGKA